ncbi:MAG TPA: DUF1553 domain-containing protein [Verrucomicrobiae bacterium]|nr:DUF1553 domain-containing protein [Verrucomicrobiae bacterium]
MQIVGSFKLLCAGCIISFAAIGPVPSLAKDRFDAEDRAHWAFQRVVRPAVPKLRHHDWVRNPIDRFIAAELEAKNIEPAAAANKQTLIRRAYLDLIGIPPAPREVDAFVADQSPQAFVRIVDKLLDSPQYGERWARHWLDLARYAESEGFKADETRPNAWRYRDYVIRALNDDKPYDRFIREQIAGDELWPDDPDALIATAFNRHYPDESNARDLRQRRQEILNDITDTVGAVFTGLTYGCARCHDHKYDPILQEDYYRLQAFFGNTAARDDIPLVSKAEIQRYRERKALWEEKTRDIRQQLDEIEAPKRRAMEKDYFDKYPAEIQAILKKPDAERNPFERQMAWKAHQYLDPSSREYVGDEAAIAGKIKGEEKKRWLELKEQLAKFSDLDPGKLPLATGMTDLGVESPAIFVLSRGSYEKPKEEVQPGFLTLLDPNPAKVIPSSKRSSGRRTALANILTDPENPLTARVMVNRVWQYHFGRGIVATPSDFGLKGERPTHPQLLDWLASEFVKGGWSLKKLHRLIMLSSTYQQTSGHRTQAAKIDPDDKLLWRFPLHRLEGEVIRDSALSVAGLLNAKIAGPSIFPELPTGMPTPRGGWKVNAEAAERNRRSIYVFVRRNTRYPLFESLDMPDPHESCARRNVTTSPIQALHLFNSKMTLEWAQYFAGRVIQTAGADPNRQIETAYRLAFGRRPDQQERETSSTFLKQQRALIAERSPGDDEPPLPLGAPAENADAAALVDFCHTLINANEFIYLN